MRYGSIFILASVLLLAACNGTAAPTQTTVPTAVPDNTATPEQQASPVPEIVLPEVGQLSSSPTEDPEAGLVFDTVIFTQTGGIGGLELTIELHGDGTLIRDGETSTVSQEDVARIDTMLDDINFFGIEGVFEAAAPNPDTYSYTITVERAGASRMIPAQDTYTPQELKELFAAIIALGQPIPEGQPNS